MIVLSGGCRCGVVRYALAVDALPRAYACHCLDCQTWSGSAFSQQIIVRDAAFSCHGSPAEYRLTGPSGSVSHQRMCGTCHARLWNTNSARPGLTIVRAGTLDRSNEIACFVHIWTKRAQLWLALPRDAQIFPESAPAEVIQALIAA